MQAMSQTTQAAIIPDYHFLYIAPTLGAEWFFDAARLYWERFQPIVLDDLGFLRLVPEGKTINVTVVARRDTVADIGVQIAQLRPDAFFDPVSYDLFNDMRAALNGRAQANAPFGVVLQSQNAQINPTPGSIINPPTRAPSGFITQTPTPDPFPTQPPAMPTLPAPLSTTPRAPIEPTPGSVIGG